MSYIYPISFRGGETAGTPAVKQAPKQSNNSGAPVPTTQPSVDTVSFRGGETAGTPAVKQVPEVPQVPTASQEQNTDTVSFKGDTKADKSGSTALAVVGGVAFTAAAAILGLAYAHKTDAFSKISNESLKKFAEKVKPFAEKCYTWCKSAKGKGVELWDKVKGMFNKKN